MVGEAQVILVREAGEPVRGRLLQKMLRQPQGPAQGNDLLGGIHAQGGEGPGAVAINGAVAHPILREVGGVDHRAAGQALCHGVEGGHADAGGQIHRSLAAGCKPRLLHLGQDALHRTLNVDGAVGDLQVLHQGLGKVNIRLHAVGHEHTIDILPAIGRHSQGRHGGAVLAAGDADDRGLAVAALHHFIHPFQ